MRSHRNAGTRCGGKVVWTCLAEGSKLTTLSFTLDANPGNEETPMSRTRSLLSIALLMITALHSVAHATLPTFRVTLHPHLIRDGTGRLTGGRGWGIENPGAVGLSGATDILASDYFVANKLQALNTSLRYTCDIAVVANPEIVGTAELPVPIYDLRNCTSLAPTCSDGIKNQDETDVDCGGTICSSCVDGATCNVASDCTSGHCQPETYGEGCPHEAGNRCIPAHCFNGVEDAFEIDVDCGYSCRLVCATGQRCDGGCACAPGHACGCYHCMDVCQ